MLSLIVRFVSPLRDVLGRGDRTILPEILKLMVAVRCRMLSRD